MRSAAFKGWVRLVWLHRFFFFFEKAHFQTNPVGHTFRRWYATIADIPAGFVELPIRLPQPDGSVTETVHPTAVTWPWDLLNWLYRSGNLLKWAANDAEPEEVYQQNTQYWGMLAGERSVQKLGLQDPGLTFPIYWHTDGVRVYKQQKCWIYSYSTALKKGPSLSSKLMLLLVREPLLWKPHTHDRIGEVIGWIQTVLQSGRFPDTDFSGQAWPPGSLEASRANQLYAGGYMCAFSAFKGGWEARVQVHKLQRSYNHNNICEHCAASKLDNEYNYRNFSLSAPYLTAQFTHAQYLQMTPPEFRSSWENVPGWTKDRNLEEPSRTFAPVHLCFPVGFNVCGSSGLLAGFGGVSSDLWKPFD